jgi:two-component system OmpR family sensor kinase
MNKSNMTELEKKSFYSFLGLYIVSSILFISLVGYWYYEAQKSSLINKTYHELEHLADMKSGEIIIAHMSMSSLKDVYVPKDIILALVDTNGRVVEGKLINPSIAINPGYFEWHDYNILISDAPREHLNIKYVVIQSKMLFSQLAVLQQSVLKVLVLVFLFIIIVAWLLSKLFMRPVRERVNQIEHFLNDITHELNTPISSLSMATDQALKQGKCTEKTLRNISISTKQLYDIYRSLTYLNFQKKEELSEVLQLDEVLKKSVAYYKPLADIKRITFETDIQETTCVVAESQLTLLIGNIIGNAIKYSSPRSTITITLKNRILSIKDEGIGIEQEKQKEIFEKFKRGTDYSGGFGVGLNIVKSICDEHGIKIELDSTLGEGTEFKLYLK